MYNKNCSLLQPRSQLPSRTMPRAETSDPRHKDSVRTLLKKNETSPFQPREASPHRRAVASPWTPPPRSTIGYRRPRLTPASPGKPRAACLPRPWENCACPSTARYADAGTDGGAHTTRRRSPPTARFRGRPSFTNRLRSAPRMEAPQAEPEGQSLRQRRRLWPGRPRLPFLLCSAGNAVVPASRCSAFLFTVIPSSPIFFALRVLCLSPARYNARARRRGRKRDAHADDNT